MKHGFTQVIMAVIGIVIGAILVMNVGIPVVQTAIMSSSMNWAGIPGGIQLAQTIPLLLIVGLVLLVVAGFVYSRR